MKNPFLLGLYSRKAKMGADKILDTEKMGTLCGNKKKLARIRKNSNETA